MNPTTLFILQLLGPLWLVVSIKILFERESFYKMMRALREKEIGMMYSLGVIVLVACTALILKHNIWEWNLSGLVTLFAWMGAAKGVLLILKPEVLVCKCYESNGFILFGGFFTLVLGGYFTYVGYFM